MFFCPFDGRMHLFCSQSRHLSCSWLPSLSLSCSRKGHIPSFVNATVCIGLCFIFACSDSDNISVCWIWCWHEVPIRRIFTYLSLCVFSRCWGCGYLLDAFFFFFVFFFFRFSFLFDCSCISSAFSRMSYFRMMFWTIPTETNDDGLYPADAVNCVGKGESREFTMEDAAFFFFLSFFPSRHGTISP